MNGKGIIFRDPPPPKQEPIKNLFIRELTEEDEKEAKEFEELLKLIHENRSS